MDFYYKDYLEEYIKQNDMNYALIQVIDTYPNVFKDWYPEFKRCVLKAKRNLDYIPLISDSNFEYELCEAYNENYLAFKVFQGKK